MDHWKATEPTDDEFVLRSEYGQFAMGCVLVAYQTIYKRFCKHDSFAREWLFIQLFPEHFLGQDYFMLLSQALFHHASFAEIRFELEETFKAEKKKKLPIFIDEAQSLGSMLVNKFVSRMRKEPRSFLSVVLYAVRNLMDMQPILSGTGLELLKLENDPISNFGRMPDNSFTDFNLLSEQEIETIIGTFLCHYNSNIDSVVNVLIGRPRFVCEFISRAIESNQNVKDGF